ncbi:MAG TPA: glycine cleavage T C-terminal barrel domain-containing protein [Pyrinomonadaceae bacterium]|nr:glycine cleavage T C-terminal barrel domain-containing protein [Pyrinomonadaceae bacterium]
MTQPLTSEAIDISADAATQYAAVRENGAGLIDLSSRGRITVGGLEAVQFLNGLITNDMKTLTEDAWMPAAFPNVQGRLVASVRVMRLKDIDREKASCPSYLIDTEAATRENVLQLLQRFTLAGDFRVNDISGETAHFALEGNGAERIVNSVMGDAVAGLEERGARKTTWRGTTVTVTRAIHTAATGFDLILPADVAPELSQALINEGATPVGDDVFEVLRIEAGIPRHGVDMDETNVVSETNLDDAVSYTKGCYIGQEIIARIKYRGHVAKKLIGLSFADKRELASGDIIKSPDDKDIGRITSTAYSPRLQHTIALGYVKYDYLAAGTAVKVIHGGNEVPAQVTELPFIRDEQSDVG